MKRRRLTTIAMGIVSTLLLASTLGWAQTEDPAAYGDDYQDGTYARVQFHENGLTLERGSGSDDRPPTEQGSLNSPIYPGDVALTDSRQRVEVQLAGGTLVRIDADTGLSFLSLPDPYAEIADTTILQLSQGRIRLDALVDDKGEFRVDTPSATVYLLEDGDYRIGVDRSGLTHVATRRGLAEVVSDGGSALVRSGMRTQVYPDALPETAIAFNTFARDGFDRWVEDRIAVYRALDRGTESYSDEVYEELPVEVRPYYRELSGHGRWTYAADYGYVWYPSGVNTGWRPYNDGHWSYGPNGYFWVSAEPWGWAPYHYGNWNWVGGIGWAWTPGRVFAGSWVAWSWGSLHVGWAPLNYWGQPCWSQNYYHGYYDPHAWTFVGYGHLHHRNYQRYAVPYDRIGNHARTATVTARAPRVAPDRFARSRADWDRAAQSARSDRGARLKPIDRNARPQRTRNDVDRGLRPDRNARATRGGQATSERRSRVMADLRRTTPDGRRVGDNRQRGDRGSARDQAGVTRDRGRVDVQKRQRSTGGIVRSTAPTRTDRGSRQATSPTKDRVRDLLRKVSSPRTTPRPRTDANRGGKTPDRSGRVDRTDRSSSSRPRASTPRSTSTQRPRANTTRSPSRTPRPTAGSTRTPSRTPRPQAGSSRSSGGSRPKASGSRSSGGSRPKASGSRSSGGSRPKASGSRSSGGARPKASGSRSSGGSRPKASGSRSSGGSRPKASGSRSSGGSRPKASGSRSSGGSRPKASGSRSSGGSRPKASGSRSSGGSRPKASSSRSSGGRSRGGKKR